MKLFNWLLALLLAVSVINYPNPVNPKVGESVVFECTSVEANTNAHLYIYDMSARFIWSRPFHLTAGATNQLAWDGFTDYNQLAGTGIYLYQLISRQGRRLGKGKIWVINQ